MNDVKKYLEILIGFSERKLKKHFKIKELEFDKFETVNSYLIYQTIRDSNKNKNTLLFIPDKETKSQFYIPAIFTLALYNFVDNYIDNTTMFNKGDTLQKGRDRFIIKLISKDKVVLIKKDSTNTKYPNVPIHNLKKYIKTNANGSSKRIHKTFGSYRSFFKNYVLGIDKEVPSQFKYKSIIVTDKSIVTELKAHQINGEKIHKAFPFQYITKSGKKTDNIPIEPMIYIVNDYEVARNYILDEKETVRNITFIGQNKYKDNYLKITEDLNNGKIENCLLIGSAELKNNSIPNLHKWKWTLSELDHFNYFTTYPINKILVENNQFSSVLKDFDDTIQRIESEFEINLNELYKYVRNILPIIIPSSKSRLITQLDNVQIYFEKEGEDIVETALSEIGEYDYDKAWNEIMEKFSALVNKKKTTQFKFQKIKDFKKIDYLVTPKEYIEIWEEEVKTNTIKNIISFKEFSTLDVKNKTIVFLGFYGYNHFKSMMYNANKINILLYPQEELHFANCVNKLKREIYAELKSPDRKIISDISFKETEQIEDFDELINRLFNQDDDTRINPDYSEGFTTNIIRELTFENDTEQLELDESKLVLLKTNDKERFEKVKNLKAGDKIRVYDNSSKEELYQVALAFDVNGEFTKVEEYAKLWKTELKQFYDQFDSLTELHQILVKNGLSIKSEITLNNWVNPNSDIKFPQRKKDLFVLKKTLNSNLLNEHYDIILKSRRLYNGLMIALGRDFSDEISDYIQNKTKGKLLKQFTATQIQQFVDQNAKLRTIKTIKAMDYEQ